MCFGDCRGVPPWSQPRPSRRAGLACRARLCKTGSSAPLCRCSGAGHPRLAAPWEHPAPAPSAGRRRPSPPTPPTTQTPPIRPCRGSWSVAGRRLEATTRGAAARRSSLFLVADRRVRALPGSASPFICRTPLPLPPPPSPLWLTAMCACLAARWQPQRGGAAVAQAGRA